MTKYEVAFDILGTEINGLAFGDNGQGGCIEEYDAAYNAKSTDNEVTFSRK